MSDTPTYAFPRKLPTGEWPQDDVLRIIDQHAGMTLRDYFAGQAIAECMRIAADQTPRHHPEPLLSELLMKAAAYAYFTADAMLAERVKP